jgi:long-chain fatty acid transport protein
MMIWLVAVSMIAVPASQALAAGYNLAGTGPKALPMSGAFRAIADDWSAVHWNPAGLAGQGNSFFIEGKVLMPWSAISPRGNMFLPSPGELQDVEPATYPAGALGVTYKINEKMTAGLGIYAPTAAGASWKGLYSRPQEAWGVSEPEFDWDGMMMVIDIRPAIGYKVNEKLSVGAGLALKYGSLEFSFPRSITMDGTNFFYLDAALEGSGIGFGANIGVLYDVMPNLHVGASLAMGSALGVSGTMTQTLYTPPAAAGGFGTVAAEPDVEADFPIPMEGGIGFAYDVNPKLTVAFDVMYTNWAVADIVDISVSGTDLMMALGAATEPSDAELKLQYEDVIRFNLGAAYKFNPKLDLFAGFYYDPSAIPDETIDPAITDFVDKMNVSFGAAYKITPKLSGHFYYEYVFGDSRFVEYNAEEPGENVGGTYDLSVTTIGLGVTYMF